MAQATARVESPASAADAAALLGSASEEGLAVRLRGGGTRRGWGRPAPEPDLTIRSDALDRIVEHNVGDLTAIVGAGVPLAAAQEAFAAEGQMLALDPPPAEGATIGGTVAAGDSGPLRHRYGAIRDLVIGVEVALADGTTARAGGKVIKNVAGYDLGKLFAASFGTLGMIAEVALRLHPLPAATATAVLRSDDPATLAAAAAALAHAPVEQLALDLAWDGEGGAVLSRFGGTTPGEQAESALVVVGAGDGLATEVVEDDDGLWNKQRARQRSAAGTVVRVSGVQSRLAEIVEVARRHGGTVVARAASGLSWLVLSEREAAEAVAAVEALRRDLAPLDCVVLDAPAAVRDALDPWGPVDEATLALMRRVKARFDPRGTCNPGTFVGGI